LPPEDLVTQALAAPDWKAFGSGMSSNVCRFMLREAAKGGSRTYVQSKVVDGINERDYVFYARTNSCSAQAFTGALKFCSLVVSHVCGTPAWIKLKGNSAAKVVVPRVMLAFDRGENGYDRIATKISQCPGREVLQQLLSGMDSSRPLPQSVAVVEGSSCLGILEAFRTKSVPHLEQNMRSHALELGLLHALDVALGMGDRLQNPNVDNVTVNPTTGQIVIIDLDVCLPPYGLHKSVEELCSFTVTSAEFKRYRRNEAPGPAQDHWPACPPRMPYQGDYKRNVTQALQRDLKLYADGVAAEISRDPLRLTGSAVTYPVWLTTLYKESFLSAAKLALSEIRKGLQDGRFDPKVEDATFSSRRLKERAKQWSGL